VVEADAHEASEQNWKQSECQGAAISRFKAQCQVLKLN
jgi:hypothetical protein